MIYGGKSIKSVYGIKKLEFKENKSELQILEEMKLFENAVFSVLVEAAKEGPQNIVIGPLSTNEGVYSFEQNEMMYMYLVRALLRFVGETDGPYPILMPYNWVQIRAAVDRLISVVFTNYYEGVEEGLPPVNCFTPNENFQLPYLHFDREMLFGSTYRYEFSGKTTKILSEKEARKYIVTVQSDGKFYDVDMNLLEETGKYVFKSNGCIYWKKEEPQYISHVGLTRGKKILSGGWMKFVHGKITCVSRATGHYRANEENVDIVVKYLQRRSIDMTNVKIGGPNSQCR